MSLVIKQAMYSMRGFVWSTSTRRCFSPKQREREREKVDDIETQTKQTKSFRIRYTIYVPIERGGVREAELGVKESNGISTEKTRDFPNLHGLRANTSIRHGESGK